MEQRNLLYYRYNKKKVTYMHKINPVHPGEILKTEFLEPFGISAYRLAKDIEVPINRITEIITICLICW